MSGAVLAVRCMVLNILLGTYIPLMTIKCPFFAFSLTSATFPIPPYWILLFTMCVANTDASLLYFILLICSFYITFSDLSACQTYALLQSVHVNRISDFGVMLSKLLCLLFCMLFYVYGLKNFSNCVYVVACVCKGGPFLVVCLYSCCRL